MDGSRGRSKKGAGFLNLTLAGLCLNWTLLVRTARASYQNPLCVYIGRVSISRAGPETRLQLEKFPYFIQFAIMSRSRPRRLLPGGRRSGNNLSKTNLTLRVTLLRLIIRLLGFQISLLSIIIRRKTPKSKRSTFFVYR